jgi:V8-like Glu-specific endopeptidase
MEHFAMDKRSLSFLFSLFAASGAHAGVDGITNDATNQARTQLNATARDYVMAKGVLPLAASLPDSAFDNNVKLAGPRRVVGENGHPPLAKWRGGATKLFDTSLFSGDLVGSMLEQSLQPTPEAVGSGGIQFTSSRVYPTQADTTYPTSATGKLWFTINGAWYICSGTMVKPGIVVTAGHCVHEGNRSTTGWHSNFQFVPAYRNGSAPYGVWTNWTFANTTSTWYNGGGGVPNDADYAVIVFNKNSSGKRIGDYTGWLGWQYPDLIGKHNTVFGYPANLDSGLTNHRVDSNVNQGGGNTGVWGSDMTGGSSGGGVVFNLRVDYSGEPSGWDFNANRLVSVVSYGYTTTSVMVQGGSQFDSRFQTLLNNTCASYSWAC